MKNHYHNHWLINKTLRDPYQRFNIARAMTGMSVDSHPLTVSGILRLQNIDGKCVDRVNERLVNTPSYDNPYREPGGEAQNVRFYWFDDLFEIKELCDIATNQYVLDIVASYLGANFEVGSFQVWDSFPIGTDCGAEVLHRDTDDYRFLKLFVYLSDVSLDSGPHVYVPGSAAPAIWAEKIEERVSSEFLRLWFGSNGRDLLRNERAVDAIDKHSITLTGVKGTSFIENTYGLHYGKHPSKFQRRIFVVLYTISGMRPCITKERLMLFQRAKRTPRSIEIYHSESKYKIFKSYFESYSE